MGRRTTTVRRAVAAWTVAAVAGALGLVALAVPASAADPCGTGSNPIVCENSKPGTDPSVWDITGAGDASIQGFATDISVNVGGTIGFKIDTAATAYTIDIYRTGWYGGLGARKIASVTPSATLPQKQPQCISDATTENYDCGNWAISATWTVPTTAVSGVYVAKLTDPKLNDSSQITFVVRDDSSHSSIVMQTSDPTWQAYNTYGGSDFYQGAANGRAYKISYNRPVSTRGLNSGRDFYFSSEYATVRFLEQNGYDVSYLSGVDTDRYGALLKNHKTFLSVGHDEYWSGAQRANVEAARDAGVNLVFLSGNEVYWRTRYEPSIDGTSTSYRTLVSYKETWSDAKIDPSPQWTGTWRDPRFAPQPEGGGLPENGLTGTLYMSNNTDLAVQVSSTEGKLRLWRNTSLTSLAPGTTATLAAHTVGYESDESPDNGFRPAGQIFLSTTVGAVPQYLQDFGTVVQPGTTTQHLSLYRAPSGALVFSAGSIQWSWGLDQTHDGDGAAADPRMRQATVNLLADMGAQPLTLAAGLTPATASTDTVGPTTVITSPIAGAAVPNGTSVTVTGTASDSGGGVVAGVEVSTDGGTTWHPATGTTSWSYTYQQAGLGSTPILARAIDDSANIGTAASVSVGVSCPCTLYGSTVPAVPAASDTSAVELGLKFSTTTAGYVTGVRFYKSTANTGTHVGSLWTSSGQRLASVTFSGESASGWQKATFSQAVAVSAGTTYVVSYTAPAGGYAVQSGAFWYAGRTQAPLAAPGGFGTYGGVYAAAGAFPTQTYGASQYYVDVLFSDVNTTPLTISGQTPLPGSTSVPPGTPVQVTFSKDVTPSSVALTMVSGSGTSVAGTTTYDSTARVATFTPGAALAASTKYTVTAAATSNTGGVSGGASWSFTTAAPDQVAGGSPVSLYNDSATPATLEVPDYSAVTLGTRFASSSDGVVNGVRFYKGPNNGGTHVGALWAVGSSTPLAQVTFTNESTEGWQTATFSTPVHITHDTEYVVSYRTTVGRYSATAGAFSGTGVQRAPLRTASDSGMYSYADAYPGSTTSTSYLVDVVFTPAVQPLVVVSQTPAAGNVGVATGTAVSVTMSAPLTSGATLSLAAGSTPVTGTSALSADGLTLTFTPAAALAAGVTYTATTSSLTSTGGATSAPVTWSFTTASAGGCPCTLFGSVAPQTAAANDASSVELGVAFTPTQSGLITGVRFYKGTGNGGTHTGTLWSSTGTALRTVTFTGESSSGWQTATFSTPYEVTVGTTYVVSYLAPQGHYAVTSNFFTADVVSGPLTAPASGNGRYLYGGGFPTSTWQQSNYFVDVLFTLAPPSPPTVTSTAPPAGATGVSTGATISATLSKAPASGTPTLALTGPSGAVAGAVSYDSTSLTVTFTPSAALAAGTSYSAAVSLGGTALTGGSWTFTTAAPAPTAVTIWPDSTVPTYPSWNDPATVQVGTRFTPSVAGSVTAIRFYKGAANTGTHTVMLWGPSQTLMAQAPSTSESASGWQTVPLPAPVTLTAGQTYTASYLSSTGGYAVTPNMLASPVTSGVLSTPAGAGAYVYGSGFPGSSSNAWYGVDLVFVPAG
ncbi:DUF4082 domain-containing protein [Cellulomonas sp. NTE-D12]|uniref:DUF4082 domain-containing protein n=1 Tax=Cellulomonas sp. NTE-D12 TaxID=2962632 RepID=UPI003081A8F4|nr:hypothetical protein CELD12_08340 [Cellulomonas sp. NTE-D12]